MGNTEIIVNENKTGIAVYSKSQRLVLQETGEMLESQDFQIINYPSK